MKQAPKEQVGKKNAQGDGVHGSAAGNPKAESLACLQPVHPQAHWFKHCRVHEKQAEGFKDANCTDLP